MDRVVHKSWTRMPVEHETAVPQAAELLLHVDRLRKLREALVARPLADVDHLVTVGHAISAADAKHRELLEAVEKRKSKSRRRKIVSQLDDDAQKASKAADAAKKASAPDKLKEMRRELQAALARLEVLQSGEDNQAAVTGHQTPRHLGAEPPELLRTSPFSRVRMGSTASSKLNFIINEASRDFVK